MGNIGPDQLAVNRKIAESVAPALARLLPAKDIRKWARQAKMVVGSGLYSPEVTLRQCVAKQISLQSTRALESDLACNARALKKEGLKRLPETTPDGKDFCRARACLALLIFREALSCLARRSCASAADSYKGLTIAMLDGTTASVPRTDRNLKHFKQASGRHGKSHFPIVRLALLFCAGLIYALAIDPYDTSELVQASQLLLTLPENLLLLADGLYGSFVNLALVTRRHSHLICPRHVNRKGQLIKRLGLGEWIERLPKPCHAHCRHPELLAGLPDYVDVRVIQKVVHRRGYRDYTLVLYTTLLDHREYPAEDIVALYLRRWSIELDIRTLKLQHGLTGLTCKSPGTVEREIYSACLAFNCVRSTMGETGQQVHRLSHAIAVSQLARTDAKMTFASPAMRVALVRAMLLLIGAALLPHQLRPPEARAVVHSTRRFPYLKCTRKQWRAWHRVAA